MKISFKLLGIVVLGVLILGGNSVRGETIQDAVDSALKTHPEIKSTAYNRLARDKEVIQAKSGYYPRIDASSGVGLNTQSHPFYDTSWPRTAVLSLRQNAFQFYATKYEVGRQEARVKSAAYQLQGTSENVALQASRVFLNMLRHLELHELAKENLTNHERIHDQMKLRGAAGVDRKADLDQVAGRLALAQSNMVVTSANIIDAKTDYQAVTGFMPDDLIKPQPVGSAIPASMEEAEQQAVKNHPILKSAKADLEARVAQHEVAKRTSYPSIDLAADYKWDNDTAAIPQGYKEDFAATAMVSFNIFNGWWYKARIDETALLVNEAQKILSNTRRQIVQSIRLSWESHKAAAERLTPLEEYVNSTGLTAEAFAAQWNIGRRTMFDVLDTQAEYINAKANLVNAHYDKMIAEYRILSGMGVLVHTLGLQWPDESRVDLVRTGDPKKMQSP